jgi:hypothetical protein
MRLHGIGRSNVATAAGPSVCRPSREGKGLCALRAARCADCVGAQGETKRWDAHLLSLACAPIVWILLSRRPGDGTANAK